MINYLIMSRKAALILICVVSTVKLYIVTRNLICSAPFGNFAYVEKSWYLNGCGSKKFYIGTIDVSSGNIVTNYKTKTITETIGRVSYSKAQDYFIISIKNYCEKICKSDHSANLNLLGTVGTISGSCKNLVQEKNNSFWALFNAGVTHFEITNTDILSVINRFFIQRHNSI